MNKTGGKWWEGKKMVGFCCFSLFITILVRNGAMAAMGNEEKWRGFISLFCFSSW